MGRRKWNVLKLNKELSAKVSADLGIDPVAALLLTQRNIAGVDDLKSFVNNSFDFIDPLTLPDMEKAVDRINDAIFDGELICIFGDYDCDGVTSTALLYSYLEAQGANVTYLLPHRVEDGYGLNNNLIKRIAELGTNLFITVDNGISSVEEAKYIKELGMDLIVTDHHIEGDELPQCVAVVDPHRKDVDCPFREYAGVGVALMLCCAIEGNTERVMDDFSDLAAIGTVADLVPLVGENRKIVKYGLNLINTCPRPGVESLIKVAKLEGKAIESTAIGFGLGPRINAAGRMDTAERALDLLLCDEPFTCDELAEELESLNHKRHDEEDRIFKEAMAELQSNPDLEHSPVIVVAGKDWHEGVLGIVASKILDRTLKPTIVLGINEDGLAKGSARSVEGFNIYNAIEYAKDTLVRFGGHEQAAGMSLEESNLDAFRAKLNEYAYSVGIVYPTTNIDIRLSTEAVSLETLDSLEVLEPFGNSNETPVFGLFKLVIDDVRGMGEDGKHKRITVHRDGKFGSINVIKFNAPDFPYERGDRVDMIVTLGRNEYKGRVSVNVLLKDIRPSGVDDDAMAQSEILFDMLLSGAKLTKEQATSLTPSRDIFSAVYRFLKRRSGINISDYEYICNKVNEMTGVNADLCKVRVVLTAMQSLGLITLVDGMITLPAMDGKVDLNSAEIIKKLGEF